MSKAELLFESGGHFYGEKSAEGWAVYKDGGTKHYSDGSRRLGLCFPVFLVHECINKEMVEELVEAAAKAMNESGAFDA